MLTLYEVCMRRTARLLQELYWDPNLPLIQNPFASLPSTIVDTLIIYLTRISSSSDLHSQLRLLVSSGQVRNFTLVDDDLADSFLSPGLLAGSISTERNPYLQVKEFQKILTDLKLSCHNLVSLKINHSSFLYPCPFEAEECLDQLLRAASNIRCIESCLYVHLQCLSSCVKLEKILFLHHSRYMENVTGFLKHDGTFKIHATLKHFKVGVTVYDVLSYSDVAVILKYCPELISINHDVSKALQHLHAQEFHNGTLSHKYKLRKFLLGCAKSIHVEDIPENCEFSGRVGALIASLTCPQLEELHLTLEDDEFISAFSDCQNLKTLKVWCRRTTSGYNWIYEDYNLELRSLLEMPNIGRNLKCLEINTFTHVDFPSIDAFCPNLEALMTRHIFCDIYRPAVAFKKLKVLGFQFFAPDGDKFDTLVELISKATNLEELRLLEEVTDKTLNEILEKNSLSKLKKLHLNTDSVSLTAWRNLACKLTALERVEIYHSDIFRHTFEKIEDVFYDIRPKVKVVSDLWD